MTITDDQVAALKAALARDVASYEHVSERLDRSDGWGQYPIFCQAAFFEAVDRRFGEDYSTSEIIRFVADARARCSTIGQDFEPRAAERLVLAALGEGGAGDLNDNTVLSTEIALLGALMNDQDLDPTRLDEFLNDARTLADEWISS